MLDLKKRLLIPVLGLVLTLATVACNADDRPDTTSPDGSSTTEPVGS